MADKWLIAKNEAHDYVLAQHGWTKERRGGLVFLSEFEAQAHIDSRFINGHTVRATAEDLGAAPGMAGAALTEYDPYGLAAQR